MGWEAEESTAALEASGGDVVAAAEALAAQEEEDLERCALLLGKIIGVVDSQEASTSCTYE